MPAPPGGRLAPSYAGKLLGRGCSQREGTDVTSGSIYSAGRAGAVGDAAILVPVPLPSNYASITIALPVLVCLGNTHWKWPILVFYSLLLKSINGLCLMTWACDIGPMLSLLCGNTPTYAASPLLLTCCHSKLGNHLPAEITERRPYLISLRIASSSLSQEWAVIGAGFASIRGLAARRT